MHWVTSYLFRAQVYQLMNRRDDAMRDLTKAIALAQDRHTKVAGQAHTQRGILYKLMGDEKAALADFEAGSRFGNSLAKKEAAALNPYAKLCADMVKIAMKPFFAPAANSINNNNNCASSQQQQQQ